MTNESFSLVRSLIENYPGDRFLYLHRSVVVVRCLQWDFTEKSIHADLKFERLVLGDEWCNRQWKFGVRHDDINHGNLKNKWLSGCQLRDTIVLDPQLFDSAKSVNPTSDKAVKEALAIRLGRLPSYQQ